MLPYEATELCYESLRLEHKPMVDAYLAAHPMDNSEMTFADLFIWRRSWGVSLCVINGSLILRGDHHGKDFYFYPVLGNNLKIPLQSILDYTDSRGIRFEMRGVTPAYKHAMENIFQNTFCFTKDYDFYDYVYHLNSLQTLSGKKLHAKRNHINSFLVKHKNVVFRPLIDDDYKECMALYDIWLDDHKDKQSRNTEYLSRESCLAYINMIDERNMVDETLRHRKTLGLEGGVVLLDGVVQAFTVGEHVRDQFIVHLEKANPGISGLYAYINRQMALSLSGRDIVYVNREEDMGIEGLRKAKRSYKPVKMIEKYIARRICEQ